MKYLLMLCMCILLLHCKSKSNHQIIENMETTKNSSEFPVHKTDQEWKSILGDISYSILRQKGTEQPFTSEFETKWDSGTYVCHVYFWILAENGMFEHVLLWTKVIWLFSDT